MTAIMKSYKITFLTGFHISAVVGVFAAIDLAAQGKTEPAVIFAILSAFTVSGLALWWIVRIAKYSVETRELIRKGVDVASLASIAVAVGITLSVAIWDE